MVSDVDEKQNKNIGETLVVNKLKNNNNAAGNSMQREL